MPSSSLSAANKKAAKLPQISPECLSLGRRVKELRAEREITQEELADRAGLFRTYLSRVERGTANPTLSMLHALAKALDVPVPELFSWPGTAFPSRVKPKVPSPSRGRVSR